MAASAKAYDAFGETLGLKGYTASLHGTTALKIALYTNATAPTQADTAAAGLTEVSNANGYSTGGATLASVTCAKSNHVVTLDAADPSWTVTGAGFTYRYARIYDATATKNIAYIDFGADVVATAGTHTITLHASGIATITAT